MVNNVTVDAADPLELLIQLIPGSPYDYTGLDDKRFADAATKAAETTDDQERARLTTQRSDLQRPSLRNPPVLPGCSPVPEQRRHRCPSEQPVAVVLPVGGDGGQVLIQFVGLRLLRLVVTLLACSFVVYGALYLAPGGRHRRHHRRASVVRLRSGRNHQGLHLDEPFVERYTTWLGRAVTGDLGQSLVARQPVIDLITPRIETTAMLVGYSGLLIIVFGIGLGSSRQREAARSTG